MEKQIELTLEFKFGALMEGIQACLDGRASTTGVVDTKGLAALISEANKMSGHYAPETHVNANVSSSVDGDLISCGSQKS